METAPAAALNFYRRHGRKCAASRPADSMTSEPEERRRGFQKCECPIYFNGTLDGVSRKHATRQSDWEVARQIAAPYLAAGSWAVSGDPLPPPPPAPVAAAPDSPGGLPNAFDRDTPPLKVGQAIDECLASLATGDPAAEATQKKYRGVLRGGAGLENFCRDRGLRYVQEMTPKLVRQLRDSWQVAASTRRTKMSILKPFFEQLVEDEAIKTNPARIRQRRNRAASKGREEAASGLALAATSEPRESFTDDEVRRMLIGCKTYGVTERKWPKKKDGRQIVAISEYREYARKVDGDDLADFIELSIATGLRFLDVAKFHVDRLTPAGTVRLRAQKNGNWVCVAIAPRLQEMIRHRARRVGPYIFGDPTGRQDHDIYQCWWKRLKALWKATGPWTHTPVHHRFRHTFVRVLLQKGAPPSLVATLIGDTEETVRRHYLNWIPEIQEATDVVMHKVAAGFPARP